MRLLSNSLLLGQVAHHGRSIAAQINPVDANAKTQMVGKEARMLKKASRGEWWQAVGSGAAGSGYFDVLSTASLGWFEFSAVALARPYLWPSLLRAPSQLLPVRLSCRSTPKRTSGWFERARDPGYWPRAAPAPSALFERTP